MRYRVTIMADNTSLRGYATPEVLHLLDHWAGMPEVKDKVLVIVSPAEDDYDPFTSAEEQG